MIITANSFPLSDFYDTSRSIFVILKAVGSRVLGVVASQAGDIAVILEFNKKYGLGIAELDRYHLKLFNLFFLFEACKGKKHKINSALKLLNEIIELSDIHFALEENMLDEYAFPDRNKHKMEHERLSAELGYFAKWFESSGELVSKKDASFIRNWLEEHLLESDMDFREHLKKRGVA